MHVSTEAGWQMSSSATVVLQPYYWTNTACSGPSNEAEDGIMYATSAANNHPCRQMSCR